MELKFSQAAGDRGGATRKTTDYNKAAVYLKQIVHSIECSGKIGAVSIQTIIYSVIYPLTHSLTIHPLIYLLSCMPLGGCKSTMCKQTTSILMHCNNCNDEFCMVSGCATTKKLLMHSNTCAIFHKLIRRKLTSR